MRCPHCGRPVELVKGNGMVSGGWERGEAMNNSAPAPWSGTAAMPDNMASYRRQSPAREPSLQGDVLVPAAQSLITGLVVAVPAAAIAGAMGYDLPSAMQTGLGFGVAGVTVTWLIKLDVHSRLLWLIESATGRDADGDGKVGKPGPVPVEITHYTPSGGFQSMNRFELPEGVTQEMFVNWCRQVTTGVKTPARANWVGRGNPFSRDQYDLMLDKLAEAGIVHDSGDGRGRQLTAGGKRALGRMISGQAAGGGERV